MNVKRTIAKKKKNAKKNVNFQNSMRNAKILKTKFNKRILNLRPSSVHIPIPSIEVLDNIISDLMELNALNSKTWNGLQFRNFSVLLFSILKRFDIQRSKIRSFFIEFNLLHDKNCEIHFNKIISGDYSSVYKDGRGGKMSYGIYNFYPELEIKAREFSWAEATKKEANFTVRALADFITTEYKKISKDEVLEANALIRSISSCRQDLIRWGVLNVENKLMPYANGHEEPEVVEYRKEFIQEMKKNMDFYYTVCEENDEAEKNNENFNEKFILLKKEFAELELTWKIPIKQEGQKKRILLNHDETTHKSGEMSRKRLNLR